MLCIYAEWPNEEALDGSCRTFSAVYCKKKNELVLKNIPCEGKVLAGERDVPGTEKGVPVGTIQPSTPAA